jgi:hypothetical protein
MSTLNAWLRPDMQRAMSQDSNGAIAVIGIDIGKNSEQSSHHTLS